MSNPQHQVLATNHPPVDIVEQARLLTTTRNCPVYIYQCTSGWGFTAKLTNIPNGALITVINNNDGEELWNTGGC